MLLKNFQLTKKFTLKSFFKYTACSALIVSSLSAPVFPAMAHQTPTGEISISNVQTEQSNDFTIIQEDADFILNKYNGNEESIIIPDYVTKIGIGAFNNCKNLKSVTFPNGLTEIGNGAFIGCTNLESVIIPETVTKIGVNAFQECRELKDIKLPEKLIELGSKKNVDGIQNGETVEIEGGVFAGCINLKSITIPESIKEIGKQNFEYCKSLESVNIKGNIEKIGKSAFNKCINLNQINIPESIKSIEMYAFFGCENLNLTLQNPKIINFGIHSLNYNEKFENEDVISLEDAQPNNEKHAAQLAKQAHDKICDIIKRAKRDNLPLNKDLFIYHRSYGDKFSALLNKYDGYNNPPKIITKQEFDSEIKKRSKNINNEQQNNDKNCCEKMKTQPCYRSFKNIDNMTPAQMSAQFKYGAFYNGSTHGSCGDDSKNLIQYEYPDANGTYVAKSANGVLAPEDNVVLQMMLKSDAKVSGRDNLLNIAEHYYFQHMDYAYKVKYNNFTIEDVIKRLVNMGHFAEILGYDAIDPCKIFSATNSNWEFVILNRGAVIVCEDDYIVAQ